MPVVTISREKGSQGSYIAQQVARALGYHFIDKTIIAAICSEYGSVEFGVIPGYVPDFWTEFDARAREQRGLMVDMLNQVILGLAHAGNVVILGRSSFAVLEKFADVLNVRIQAPLSIRTSRVMARQKIDESVRAESLIKESDRVRAGFIEWFYGSRWDACNMFNLIIDTSKVPANLAVKWLIEAAKVLPDKKAPNLYTTDAIAVDPILTSIVARVLARDVSTQER